ncbi:hypothetical protein [Donghicola sp.]|jgi:hypothetical protein|uniref:hypothetical protein n=1 Tax=Donghicola sp. TaxID=1929294 RepID=UPI0025FEF6F7|nr:hypothetical protein [Donghicola sp.]MCT4578629.1 hypothetical protein [Donghicola sp.]
MPDTDLAEGYLRTAELLANSDDEEPSQTAIRKSISCSYYAIFHGLARTLANSLIGEPVKGRSNRAWVEIYRGLDHGSCKTACKKVVKINFPPAVKDFAHQFVQMQDNRKRADYDPLFRPTRWDALTLIALVRLALEALDGVEDYDKKAFATFVLITTPGAKHSRETHKDGSKRDIILVERPA